MIAALGLPLSTGQDETAAGRGRRVLVELTRRVLAVRDKDSQRGAACLVVLDNVSDAGLLAEPQTGAGAGRRLAAERC